MLIEVLVHNPTMRVVNIINTVSAHNGEFTLSALSKQTDIPVGTIHPILKTLVQCEYLSLDKKTETYSIGLRLSLNGFPFLSSDTSYRGIHQVIANLRDKSGETCHYGQLDGGNVLYVIKEESPEPIRLYSDIGKQLPAYGTAVGKALLCDKDDAALHALYPEGLKPLTKNTITEFSKLEKELKETRESGYAYECEESNAGVRCIASPVRKQGKVVSAVSIVIPLFRYQSEKDAQYRGMLKDAVENIEKLLIGIDVAR